MIERKISFALKPEPFCCIGPSPFILSEEEEEKETTGVIPHCEKRNQFKRSEKKLY